MEALECLVSSIEALRDMYATAHDFKAQSGNVEARVEELERMRVLFEASMEGELMLARAEYRKADNAAARAKTAEANARISEDDFGGDGDDFEIRYNAWLAAQNGEEGPHDAVQPVTAPAVSAPSARAAQRARKRSRR